MLPPSLWLLYLDEAEQERSREQRRRAYDAYGSLLALSILSVVDVFQCAGTSINMAVPDHQNFSPTPQPKIWAHTAWDGTPMPRSPWVAFLCRGCLARAPERGSWVCRVGTPKREPLYPLVGHC